ncbi:MAG: hypothetical protein CMB80_01970 [Flammeovirgaceae bacterium]|nr:hypothetical protein [Flammeovirgaceae bacterium]
MANPLIPAEQEENNDKPSLATFQMGQADLSKMGISGPTETEIKTEEAPVVDTGPTQEEIQTSLADAPDTFSVIPGQYGRDDPHFLHKSRYAQRIILTDLDPVFGTLNHSVQEGILNSYEDDKREKYPLLKNPDGSFAEASFWQRSRLSFAATYEDTLETLINDYGEDNVIPKENESIIYRPTENEPFRYFNNPEAITANDLAEIAGFIPEILGSEIGETAAIPALAAKDRKAYLAARTAAIYSGAGMGDMIRMELGRQMDVRQPERGSMEELQSTALAGGLGVGGFFGGKLALKLGSKFLSPFRDKWNPKAADELKDYVRSALGKSVRLTPDMISDSAVVKFIGAVARIGMGGGRIRDVSAESAEEVFKLARKYADQVAAEGDRAWSDTDAGRILFDLFGPLGNVAGVDQPKRWKAMARLAPEDFVQAKHLRDTVMDKADELGLTFDITAIRGRDKFFAKKVDAQLRKIGIDPDAIKVRDTSVAPPEIMIPGKKSRKWRERVAKEKKLVGKPEEYKYVLNAQQAGMFRTMVGDLVAEVRNPARKAPSGWTKRGFSEFKDNLDGLIEESLDVTYGNVNLKERFIRHNALFTDVYKRQIRNSFIEKLVQRGIERPEAIPSMIVGDTGQSLTRIRTLKEALIGKKWAEGIEFPDDKVFGPEPILRPGFAVEDPARIIPPGKIVAGMEQEVASRSGVQFLDGQKANLLEQIRKIRELPVTPESAASIANIEKSISGIEKDIREAGSEYIHKTASSLAATGHIPPGIIDQTGLKLSKGTLTGISDQGKRAWKKIQVNQMQRFTGYMREQVDPVSGNMEKVFIQGFAGTDSATGLMSGRGLLRSLDKFDPKVLSELFDQVDADGTVIDMVSEMRKFGKALETIQEPGRAVAAGEVVGTVGVKLMQIGSAIGIMTKVLDPKAFAVLGLPKFFSWLMTSKAGMKWFGEGLMSEATGEGLRRSAVAFAKVGALRAEWDRRMTEDARERARSLGLPEDSVQRTRVPLSQIFQQQKIRKVLDQRGIDPIKTLNMDDVIATDESMHSSPQYPPTF